MSHKNITIIAACVDFDDYLNRIVESWLRFNPAEIVISTADDDFKTASLCDQYGLTIIKSKRPQNWVRGYYINQALHRVKTPWTLILDADCWLPNLNIDTDSLNRSNLYGLRSVEMAPEQLEDYKYDHKRKKRIRNTTIGVGFFQLFNTVKQRRRSRWYSEEFNIMPNGKGASLDFAHKWKKIKQLSNDFVVVISNTNNRLGRKTGRIPDSTYTKGELTESKVDRFKRFTNYELGITIYDKD